MRRSPSNLFENLSQTKLSEALLENRNTQTGTSAQAVSYGARFTFTDLLLTDDYEDKDVSLPAGESASERLKVSS